MGSGDPSCLHCGKPVAGFDGDIREEMLRRQACFECMFWLRLIEGHNEWSVVVDGNHYQIGSESGRGTDRRNRGHGGRRFDVWFLDGRHVTTTNLWAQGPIPERWRERLPDNATFIQEGVKAYDQSNEPREGAPGQVQVP